MSLEISITSIIVTKNIVVYNYYHTLLLAI